MLARTRNKIRLLIANAVFKQRHLLRDRIFFRDMFGLYNYMYRPCQLIYLCECLRAVKDIKGSIVEVGCAYGFTTTFLAKYMQDIGMHAPYIAIDTFSGFVPEQSRYEIEIRNKPEILQRFFSTNRKEWVAEGLRDSEVTGVNLEQMDCTNFDFDLINPIIFAIIYVDFYLPIKDILPKVYRNMAEGGIIIVDDCRDANVWDGAYHAYAEFMQDHGWETQIMADKLGIIVKGQNNFNQ
jgi:O-methyltransferase